MNTSNIFKKAHALTKATLKAGDNYAATFAICLKTVYQMAAKALTTLEFRKMQAVSKTTKKGATALMIKVSSIADEFLTSDKVFATLLGNNKIGTGYIVTGRGEVFTQGGDWQSKYQYVYVTKI